MVGCNDNYKIGSQLAKALNEFDLPYGGINMIFSRDFAQMPLVSKSPLYSGTVGTLASSDCSCDTEKEYKTKETNCRRC
jgi:hypothetical protein